MSTTVERPALGADLEDWEIDRICAGYVQNAARVRFLRAQGLTVRQKPNGRPLVNRAHYDAVMNGTGKPSAGGGIRWKVQA
ncbi:MAG: hypothetical protein ACM32J_15890 [Rhizobacter sp.]